MLAGLLFGLFSALAVWPLLQIGMGALQSFGAFLMRPLYLATVIVAFYYFLSHIFSRLVSWVGLSDVFAALAAAHPDLYAIAQFVYYLFAIDVMLGVLPGFIAARLVIRRVTFPL